MRIQIGMSCDPTSLCNGLTWLFGGIIGFLLIGVIWVVIKERERNKKRPK